MTKPPIRTSADIRDEFLDFFATRAGHTIVPSAPVVPHDDPTLLFTNAGMNQFKDVFLGQGTRPYSRAVDTQKCIRAGGKHNDLEDVGRDTYHHTFFEMLGNWSFGDYFKKEAITWAWQLLTEVWGLPKDRLYVTVFEGAPEDGTEPDEESHQLWLECTDIDPTHITRWGRQDNFWEMGASGPCGPCSEIHFDSTPDGSGADLVNADHPDVIEIWNLVFIQFNRREDGSLVSLPQKHVDTGMGLERIVRVLQAARSNYDTDLWTPLFETISKCSGARPYGGDLDDPIDIAYRVIADHIRCLTVALADGARPGSEGRGYVLRRILRRAVRLVRQTLGVSEPMLFQLVPTVAASLGGPFPELNAQTSTVADIIRDEEAAFLRTLDRGLLLFEEAIKRTTGNQLSGEAAFQLHDTFGFPIDLTELMCRERGVDLDRGDYDIRMNAAREQSRASTGGVAARTLPPEALADLNRRSVPPTDDASKYEFCDLDASVDTSIGAIWSGQSFVDTLTAGESGGLILNATSFYAEQGGQLGDIGLLSSKGVVFDVTDTRRVGDYVIHFGTLKQGSIAVGQRLDVEFDTERRFAIECNHTATHMLNLALRQVLGDEVEQQGSLVAPDRLRFDYACRNAPTHAQLADVQQRVLTAIEDNWAVDHDEVPLEEAMKINGVRAVFGERYPDPVRVVSIGPEVGELLGSPEADYWRDASVEFCGGTHLGFTGQLAAFLLVQEQALAAGVRRITAISADVAFAAIRAARALRNDVEQAAACADDELIDCIDSLTKRVDEETLGLIDRQCIRDSIDTLRDRAKSARKQAAKSTKAGAVAQAKRLAESASGEVITGVLEGIASRDDLLAAMDTISGNHPDSACLLLGTDLDAGKVLLVAKVPNPCVARGLKAGDWIKHVAGLVGGGGGGRPDMAQAGGSQPEAAADASVAAHRFATETLS